MARPSLRIADVSGVAEEVGRGRRKGHTAVAEALSMGRWVVQQGCSVTSLCMWLLSPLKGLGCRSPWTLAL